jgi:hypothetical protein
MRLWANALVVVGLVAAGAAPAALAQGSAGQTGAVAAPEAPRAARGRGGANINPQRAEQQVEQMWNAFFLSRAQEQLRLTDDQFARFFVRVQRLQRLRQQHQMRRRRLLAELATLTAPDATTDDATLAARTKALDDLDAQAAQDEQAALASIDEVLTVRQRARFRWFEDAMDRQKLQMLARVLRAGTPPQSAPAGGGG